MHTFFPKYFKLVLMLALFLLIIYQINFNDVLKYIKQINTSILTITTFLMLVTILLNAIRWRNILAAIKVNINFAQVFNLYFASLFTNIIVPGSIGGEALKIWYLHKNNISYNKAINSIILDRVSVIIATVIVVTIFGIYYLPIRSYVIKFNLLYFLLSLFLLLTTLFIIYRLYNKMSKPSLVLSFVKNAVQDIQFLFCNKQSICLVLAISLVCNLIYSLIFYLLTISLHSNINIYYFLIMIPIINIICYLPISYAGWGIRETSIMYGYYLFDIPKEIALVVSIVFGMQLIIGSLPGGICILNLNRKYSFGDQSA